MKKSIWSIFLVLVCLAIIVNGCAPATTPVPSTPTPLPTDTPLPKKTLAPTSTSVPTKTAVSPTNTSLKLNPDWLVTETDLNGFTNDIGIIDWQVTEDIPGNFRICREIIGTSWSANPNLAANCINQVVAGSTFEEVIASMYDSQILYSTDIELTPVLSYDYDFALYTYQADTGHSSYNAFLFNGDLLFRATVTVGTPLGDSPETLFDEQGEIIETFLKNILMINLERVNSNP